MNALALGYAGYRAMDWRDVVALCLGSLLVGAAEAARGPDTQEDDHA